MGFLGRSREKRGFYSGCPPLILDYLAPQRVYCDFNFHYDSPNILNGVAPICSIACLRHLYVTWSRLHTQI